MLYCEHILTQSVFFSKALGMHNIPFYRYTIVYVIIYFMAFRVFPIFFIITIFLYVHLSLTLFISSGFWGRIE